MAEPFQAFVAWRNRAIRTVGKPKALIVCAAEAAFFDIPNVGLMHFCKLLGGPYEAKDGIFDRFYKLVKLVLPSASEDTLMDIMKQRIHTPSLLEAFLTSDGADDLLCDEDKKLIKDNIAEAGSTSTYSEKKVFVEKFVMRVQSMKGSQFLGKKTKGRRPQDRADERLERAGHQRRPTTGLPSLV